MLPLKNCVPKIVVYPPVLRLAVKGALQWNVEGNPNVWIPSAQLRHPPTGNGIGYFEY